MIYEDKINRLNGRLKDIELETDELEQQRKDVEVNYYAFIENWQIFPSCYEIYVVKAQNLVPMPRRSSSNPFTTIYFGDKKSQIEMQNYNGNF